MQDIAGCRVIVADVREQDGAIGLITGSFPMSSIVDRRVKPSHGYRAVHLILHVQGKPIEVQIRTSLQHLWADMSEKCADVVDPALKYGGGPDALRGFLDKASTQVARIEELELVEAVISKHGTTDIARPERLTAIRGEFVDILQGMIRALDEGGLEEFK